MGTVSLHSGDLEVTLADNDAFGEHRSGYNGIARLTSRHCAKPLFVPALAGVNLEHIIDGIAPKETRDLFEPRFAPMTLTQTGDGEGLLHQPPTPRTGVESWTRFTLRPPAAIDIECTFQPRRAAFPHGYLGLFWASYINDPENNSIYFRGTDESRWDRWLQLSTPLHAHESTVVSVDDTPTLPMAAGGRPMLYTSFSTLRYTKPLFYGLFGTMVFALMFQNDDGLRFAHSPSGGGRNDAKDGTNPAWDFHYIINNPRVDQAYGWKARALYKPFAGRDNVLEEYDAFLHSF